jgi:hypothetical protein
MKPTELLKALFFSSLEVIWTIIKSNWEPVYTTVIKMSIIALLIWGACAIIPHGLLLLSGIPYLGWFTIILIWRLINVRYDDFDQEETEDDDDEIPFAPDDEILPVNSAPPLGNVRLKNDTSDSSTRE